MSATTAALTGASGWQRDRALRLHTAFNRLATRVQAGSTPIGTGLAALARELSGTLLGTPPRENLLKLSAATSRRAWDQWTAGGRTAEALLLDYKPGLARTAPALVKEFQRRLTLPGAKEASVAMASLARDWQDGKPIPGLGTWQEWWRTAKRTQGRPLPARAPELWVAVAKRTFYRWQPDGATKAGGTRGAAALKGRLPYVSLNYAKLRKCELFMLDDVRLDLLVIDEATGRVTEVVCYVMLEAGSRYVAGYILKPASAIKAEDVDELIAYTLCSLGVGAGYATHILFERGTVACSEAAQRVLEAASEGGIKVHRTGMTGGIRWVGAAGDRARGNSCGKAALESFNRTLHLLLRTLPAQRGNSYENQPENLGHTGGQNKDGSAKTHAGSLVAEAEKLAQFEIAGERRLKLALPMLYTGELDRIVRETITRHNGDAGHAYKGHGTHAEIETAPGVWERREPLPPLS